MGFMFVATGVTHLSTAFSSSTLDVGANPSAGRGQRSRLVEFSELKEVEWCSGSARIGVQLRL